MSAMKLTFLGTGTSFGVPVIGCDCAACTSPDPRDKRTRCGAVVETKAGRLLVDTPTELRLQLLATGIKAVDAIWFTHAHADHLHGIDDVRAFSVKRGELTGYVAAEHRPLLESHFRYIFDDSIQPPPGSSKPRLRLLPIEMGKKIDIVGESFEPIRVPHGDARVYGFRVGRLGYIVDAKLLPDDAIAALKGVDVLVLNALWFGKPHASHLNIEEAIEASRAVGAERTYLTHLTHRVTHRELEERLPSGVYPAYDGLVVEVN